MDEKLAQRLGTYQKEDINFGLIIIKRGKDFLLNQFIK